ncbi:MAG: LPS export ABC transporter periplasmic protein LptC [Bryobacterales bacterium]|nr:LPS export ABC transporter periplasmic protein LptC [Bryobacterales bacterium]
MRRLGRLIAFLFLILAVSTGTVYYYQRQKSAANAVPPAVPLPEGVSGTAERWQWTHNVDGKPMVEISAREYRMLQNPSRVELEDVELKIFGGDPTMYDLVKSKRADVDTRAKTMYSEGEVEIVMRVPNDGRAIPERPMTIRSSKVHFDTESGQARTEERTFFQFAEGFGEAVGAMYDPQAKEVTLEHEARLTFAKEGGSTPTTVQASHARYLETYSKIELSGPTRMERQNLLMDAGDATIQLQHGDIRRVETRNLSGIDRFPKRELAFGAAFAEMKYRADGSLAEIYGDGNARLDAVTPSARNELRSGRMNLYFREGAAEPELEKSFAQGGAKLRSVPLGKLASTTPRRLLEAEVVEVRMQQGGSQIEQLLTHSPGILTFLPANAQQRERKLFADRMTANYGKNNSIENFEATKVTTESQPSTAAVTEARKRKLPPPAMLRTSSDSLEAGFAGETSELQWMKQTGNFEFNEGVRRGRAKSAMLHQAEKYNLLEGNAQLWDASSSLQADRIRVTEPSGDLVAEGRVVSTQKPESRPSSAQKSDARKPGGGALPGGGATLQATAERMLMRNENQWIRYEGNAKLWQGANRLHAAAAVIDRVAGTVEGEGSVFSQIEEEERAPANSKLADAGKSDASKAAPKPRHIYTLVNASRMRYQDSDRLARYDGSVRMRRGDLSVDSDQMRLRLKETADGGTDLEQAFADGNVRVRISDPGNLRRGGGGHAEYSPADEKMVLYGEGAFFDDQRKGATRGQRLTYFSAADRLIVESGSAAPAVSVMRRNE